MRRAANVHLAFDAHRVPYPPIGMALWWRTKNGREGFDPFRSDRFRLAASLSRSPAANLKKEVRQKLPHERSSENVRQQRTHASGSARSVLSILLLICSNIILQLCLCVFVVPRIHCSSLPSPINSLCPSVVQNGVDTEGGAYIRQPNNLALLANGAQIIRRFSYVGIERQLPLFRRLFSSPLSAASYSLDGVVDLAHCWIFQGAEAQLAIRLSNYSTVTRIAIEQPYVADEVARSPRQIAVWGLVDGAEDEAHLAGHEEVYKSLLSRMHTTEDRPVHGHQFVPLAAFTYDAASAGLQTFAVFHSVAALDLEYGVILVKILNNWGGESTRFCHIGVFGDDMPFMEEF
ncbi:hypothetical protein NM688_g2645 [Phlebia brevispora]|uniref:Uncharacterized protein n=1 Tax=Phlebia brevispora TaxID=194682 RepID=A0ACC1T879_9APHY|nr:hypothetical protein NM688_g2645 [Phlebia brevispora]